MGNKKDIIDTIEDIATKKIKEKFIKFVFLKLSISPIGIKAKIIIKLINLIFDKIISPFLEDIKNEGLLIIRKKELKKKLQRYINAKTDKEFDDAFDDLIAGSTFK
jgi:hypothetical protein